MPDPARFLRHVDRLAVPPAEILAEAVRAGGSTQGFAPLIPWLRVSGCTSPRDVRGNLTGPRTVSCPKPRDERSESLGRSPAVQIDDAVLERLGEAVFTALAPVGHRKATVGQSDPFAAERRAFGICRHEVGRRLAERWGLGGRDAALDALAEVAAGAAHEMNNPLMVISGRSRLLAERLAQTRPSTPRRPGRSTARARCWPR